MCGFAGIVDFGSAESRHVAVKKITETLHSRGAHESVV